MNRQWVSGVLATIAACSMTSAPSSVPEPQGQLSAECAIEAIDRTQLPDFCMSEHFIRYIETRYLAGVAEAVAGTLSDNCRIAVMQCILNRTVMPGFPNTVEEVCKQPNQWCGYSGSSEPSTKTIRLAEKVLDSYRSSEVTILLIPRNDVFMDLGTSSIAFRPSWDSTEITYVY